MSDYLDAKVTATYQPNLRQAILHQKGTKWRHGLYNAIIGHTLRLSSGWPS